MLVPKLRFKEFKDEWNEISLKKTFTFFSTNSLSRADLTADGLIKNIHYGDIHQKFNNILDVEKEKLPYINPNIELSIKDNLCQNGDLIFVDASEDYEGIGKAIEIINIGNNKVVSGLHTIHARDIESTMSIGFKGYLFNTPIIHNQIRILANGFKVFGISKNDICNLNVRIPNKMEQEKIANLLSLLDKKIELQKRRIEALKIYKKGLISHIFNGIHSTKKLKTIVNFQNGKGYENQVDINGNYNLVSLNSITIDGKLNKFMKKIKSDLPISTLKKNDIVMIMSDVGHGDFLGVSAIIPDDNVYVLNQRVGLLRINDNTIPSYLLYAINNLQPYFKKYGQGSSQLNLSKEDILNANIPYIDIHSQEDLSNFCILLDKKIFNAEFKLENLKNLKKSLLQQMFI